jgi:hypothetical protein
MRDLPPEHARPSAQSAAALQQAEAASVRPQAMRRVRAVLPGSGNGIQQA